MPEIQYPLFSVLAFAVGVPLLCALACVAFGLFRKGEQQ